MYVLMRYFDGGGAYTVGPFADADSAREWAARNFPALPVFVAGKDGAGARLVLFGLVAPAWPA